MKGYLHLEDGDIFIGELLGNPNDIYGEVVFSTAMVGYPESLTDPSYAGQILVFTFPLIGNYGVPKPVKLGRHLNSNFESDRIWVKGVILASLEDMPSHYQSRETFCTWLSNQNIPILEGVDTRALTQKIREYGVMQGVITNKLKKIDWRRNKFNYHEVSLKKIISYLPENKISGKRICLIDCGVKHAIIRTLLKNGYEVVRVPWNYNPLNLKQKIDAVVVSNGPGDPKDWRETIDNVRKILKANLPLIGVCLGHQLLSLAIGADTFKLKYGHRGLNQPVQDKKSSKCYLTSQNHGYAVKTETIPLRYNEWFVNLNDGTNEGIRNEKEKIWSIQFHPEGNPGPFDTDWILNML